MALTVNGFALLGATPDDRVHPTCSGVFAMNFRLPSSLLKTTLWADAAVSGSVAVLQLVLTDWLADWLGISSPLLSGSGLFLVAYVALLVLMARAQRLPEPLVWLVIGGNAGWAAGCLVLALAGPAQTSAWGAAYLVLQALAVLAFAALQWLGLRRSTPEVAMRPAMGG
jgi:hypothetical protein